MHQTVMDEIKEAREEMKKEDFWHKSRKQADKRVRLRTLELQRPRERWRGIHDRRKRCVKVKEVGSIWAWSGVDLYATHENEEYALITQVVFSTPHREKICSPDALEVYG